MLDKLKQSIYEALEIDVIKDGNLKLPVEEFTVRSYDEVTGYAGRARKPMIDWVTEYNYVTKQDLSREEFEKMLQDKYNLTGIIQPAHKKKLTFANGDIYYRYIKKTVMF